MEHFTKARFQARLYGFCWTILETRQADFDADTVKKQNWIVTILQATEYANEDETVVINKLAELIKSKEDIHDEDAAIIGLTEGKQVVYKNMKPSFLLIDEDVQELYEKENTLEYYTRLVEQFNKKEKEEKWRKEEEKKTIRTIGLAISGIALLFIIVSMLLHHKEFLILLFLVALFTFIGGISQFSEKNRIWGTILLIYTAVFIIIPIVIFNYYDNVRILSVNSRTNVQEKYYSLCITDHYKRNNGCSVPLKRGKYIENNTTDTLVIYSVTYSSFIYPSLGKAHYPIVQTIAPKSFEILLETPDYVFQSPPQSISVRKKRGETVNYQTRYVLEYKRRL